MGMDEDATRVGGSDQTARGVTEGALPGLPSYVVMEEIGAGGMGVVYLARQIMPERLVALKLISDRKVPREMLARFEEEYQVLAMMNHPRIAAFYDVGVTNQGEPYFTMEYVPGGEALTTYCQHHDLSLRRRLLLFLQVCDGVLHAHQRAVVHRDLKPANILVTGADGASAVKIIDFGIAKRLRPNSQPLCETRAGDLMGTPAYMSPEQLTGGDASVDALSDIYALGVILYELACGSQPFDGDRLSQLPMDERLRIFREEDPPRPSERVKGGFDRDLDAVILKAMAREPAGRYATVADLARDIGNVLDQRPVSAKPRGWSYLTSRYVKRNKLKLIAAAALVLALFGAGRVAWQQSRMEAARQSAQSLNELVGAIQWMPGFENGGRELQILASLEEELANWPGEGDALKAKTCNTLGEFYMVYGKYELAVSYFQDALSMAPTSTEENAIYRHNLSRAYRRLGEINQAVKHARTSLAFFASDPQFQTQEARVAVSLGQALRRQPQHVPEAETLLEEAVAVLTRTQGQSHKDTLLALSSYGAVLVAQKKYIQAETVYRQVLDQGAVIYGKGQPMMLAARKNLATSLRRQGRMQEAEPLLRESLQIRKQVFPADHGSITGSMFSLGVFLFQTGKYREAEALLGETLERRRREGMSRNAMITANWLAQVLWIEDKRDQAIACLEEQLRLASPQKDKDQRLRTMNNLVLYLLDSQQVARALPLAREAVQLGDASTNSSMWYARLNLARAYEASDPADAEESYDVLLKAAEVIENKDLVLLIHGYEALFRAGRGDERARRELKGYLPQLTSVGQRDLRERIEAFLNR